MINSNEAKSNQENRPGGTYGDSGDLTPLDFGRYIEIIGHIFSATF